MEELKQLNADSPADGWEVKDGSLADRKELKNGSSTEDSELTSENISELSDEPGTPGRDQWGSRVEFLLALIGYTVGIGSIWRFPIICAKNGGGAFLIPFIIINITCGAPLYYLEICLGQFTGRSALTAFEYCPLMKGLGALMVSLSFVVTWYIMGVMMWIIYFLYSSFASVLPWTTCHNWWNTPACQVPTSNGNQTTTLYIDTNDTLSPELDNITAVMGDNSSTTTSPAIEFWMHNVLRKSNSLEEMGSIQLHLILCLLVAWAIVVFAVIKGVKSLGKVVYVTATLPYVLLTVMLIRGLLLDGAIDGIMYFITPDFEKLTHTEVWLEAAVQVFYSLGPTWGGCITMASYNKFNQKSFRDTVIVVTSDIFTACYSGLVVFTIIGFMARESGTTVAQVAKASGPGLAFVAYPTALGKMPLPQFWSVLFFIMLVTVAFDSDFGMFETVASGLIDYFPRQLRSRRVLVNLSLGGVMFLAGTVFTTNGGIYLFQLVDWYSTAFALLLGSSLEGISVCWIYGADRFSKDIEMMTGRQASVCLRIFWTLVMPTVMTVSFIALLWCYAEPDYGDGYIYKPYAIAIGFLMGLAPIILLVAVGARQLIKADGSIVTRIRSTLRPSSEWGPRGLKNREMYAHQPYIYQTSLLARIRLNVIGDKQTAFI